MTQKRPVPSSLIAVDGTAHAIFEFPSNKKSFNTVRLWLRCRFFRGAIDTLSYPHAEIWRDLDTDCVSRYDGNTDQEDGMKLILGLTLLLTLPVALFAEEPDMVFSATRGSDILFGVLHGRRAQLILAASRSDPAAGTVGFTTVTQKEAGSDTFVVFYTYTNPSNNRPALARNTYDISNITDGTSNTILLTESKRFPGILGDYDVSLFEKLLPYIESSFFAQPEDPGFRGLNASSNPFGPTKKLANLPSGITSVRTNFSEDGTAGASAFFIPNPGPSLFTYKCPSDGPPKVETVNRFVTQNQITDFQWTNLVTGGSHYILYRELRSSGDQFKTFVGGRRFQDGLPVGNITTVNPLINISGPGTQGYANSFFGQVATDPNANWFLWTSYPPSCPGGEWYSRWWNPETEKFGGGKSKLFGNCNVALADGNVRTVRSMDVTRYNP